MLNLDNYKFKNQNKNTNTNRKKFLKPIDKAC